MDGISAAGRSAQLGVNETSVAARTEVWPLDLVVGVPVEPPELTPRLAAVLLRVLRKAAKEQSVDEIPTADSDEALRSRTS